MRVAPLGDRACEKCRVAVLISGRGSNMRALIEAAREPDFPAAIVLVLADLEAAGCEIAREAGIETRIACYKTLGKKQAEEEIERWLDKNNIDIVCLAGFKRILSPCFVARWQGRILNIHPSLLPHFRGLDTHRRVLEAKHDKHGCSVHVVTEHLDEGEILGQEHLVIEPNDTPESLASRVLERELLLYSRVLAEYVRRLGARAWLRGSVAEEEKAGGRTGKHA